MSLHIDENRYSSFAIFQILDAKLQKLAEQPEYTSHIRIIMKGSAKSICAKTQAIT